MRGNTKGEKKENEGRLREGEEEDKEKRSERRGEQMEGREGKDKQLEKERVMEEQ